jgi:hypothetical protein
VMTPSRPEAGSSTRSISRAWASSSITVVMGSPRPLCAAVGPAVALYCTWHATDARRAEYRRTTRWASQRAPGRASCCHPHPAPVGWHPGTQARIPCRPTTCSVPTVCHGWHACTESLTLARLHGESKR